MSYPGRSPVVTVMPQISAHLGCARKRNSAQWSGLCALRVCLMPIYIYILEHSTYNVSSFKFQGRSHKCQPWRRRRPPVHGWWYYLACLWTDSDVTVFTDTQEPVLLHYQKKGSTINSARYSVMMLHGNARSCTFAHSSTLPTLFINILPHQCWPPWSPERSP